MQDKSVGVVPQLRYLRMWNDESTVNELQRRLHDLLNVKNSQLPMVYLTTFDYNPKAFAQFCGAFDWFLEQI